MFILSADECDTGGKAMREKVILSLGSNVGDGKVNIGRALSALEENGFIAQKISSFYETEPVGFKDQNDFINAAISGSFEGEPEELLEVISEVESTLGRIRVLKYGPRTIDIDIILFGSGKVVSEKLTVPHPEFRKRRFVLEPAAEIEPEMKDPVTGKSLKELLEECTDSSEVKKV